MHGGGDLVSIALGSFRITTCTRDVTVTAVASSAERLREMQAIGVDAPRLPDRYTGRSGVDAA